MDYHMSLRNKFFICLLLIFYVFNVDAYSRPSKNSQDSSVFIGILIDNEDGLIPSFLKSIEKFDYDKKLISLQINDCNVNPQTKMFIQNWAKKNAKSYKQLAYVDNTLMKRKELTNREISQIKDQFLDQTLKRECDYCLITQSGIYLAPKTLKTLIAQDKPIISPLLRTFPEANDFYRNFFSDVTDEGYFKLNPDYMKITNREIVGTFKVPCVHGVYLIKAPFIDKLSFDYPDSEWGFIAFSNMARKNHIDQYICNSQEFGSFLHFTEEMSKDKISQFTQIKEDADVNPEMLQRLFSSYTEKDEALKNFIAAFDYDKYLIYRVNNQDLFYLNEEDDDQETLLLKNGEFPFEGVYEGLDSHIQAGDVIVVAGGKSIVHLLDLSNLVGAEGRIHVFEPDLKKFTELVINTSLNECKNIDFYRIGLGADHGNDPISSVEKLDDQKIKAISMISIDASGKEMDVVQGALQTILQLKPEVVIRFPTHLKKQVITQFIQSIENLGYHHFATSTSNVHLFSSTQKNDGKLYDKNVTIAILAKDKAHILPLYLACIELQNWPKNKTNLYIRTNNNTDATAQILRDWVAKVGDQYALVHFDDSDVPEKVEQYKQHEWNSIRFKVLGKIRQDSVDWANAHNSHYFVVDCDNFIHPDTLSAMVRTQVPIVAPFLRAEDNSLYANYHAAVDVNGYLAETPYYFSVFTGEVKGLIDLPVVHCTYFIQHNVLSKIIYDDDTDRYEYVIFSDQARRQNIPQYLDNRKLYGRLTFAESEDDISKEGWLSEFWYTGIK